jgi:hypothetical protein
MKTKHSVLQLVVALFSMAVISALTTSTSQAGSQVGFRDVVTSARQISPTPLPKIQPVVTPQINAAGVNRHGADDPANHDKGDDRGHHGGGHR